MLADPDSQRKTKSFRNMSFLGTNRVRLNPRGGKEGTIKVIRRKRAQAVVAEDGGVGVAEAGDIEAGDMVEEGEGEGEGEVGIPVTGLSRTRTRLQEAITTGSEVMKRRWQGEDRHLRREIVHWDDVEL